MAQATYPAPANIAIWVGAADGGWGIESVSILVNGEAVIAEGDKVGDALYNGKFDATTNYGWDRVYEYMNLYNFNLYGDPALAINRATATAVASRAAGSAPPDGSGSDRQPRIGPQGVAHHRDAAGQRHTTRRVPLPGLIAPPSSDCRN